MLVMVCDDSRTIQLILQNLLYELGYPSVTAGSVQAAKDLLKQQEIDHVLLDIHLPDGEGFEVLEEAVAAGIPAIMISSDTDYRQISKARDMGAKGYIKKPFRKEALEEALGI